MLLISFILSSSMQSYHWPIWSIILLDIIRLLCNGLLPRSLWLIPLSYLIIVPAQVLLMMASIIAYVIGYYTLHNFNISHIEHIDAFFKDNILLCCLMLPHGNVARVASSVAAVSIWNILTFARLWGLPLV